MLILSIFTAGCNIFEGIEKNLNPEDNHEYIELGNIALAKGDYNKAEEYFDRAIKNNYLTDEVYKGKAECIAGKEGFNVITILNILQNSNYPPYDKSQILFKLNAYNYDYNKMLQSAQWMAKVKNLTSADKLTYSLISLCYAVKIIIKKYDTNNNKRLDIYDNVNFETSDDKYKPWESIYDELISSSTSPVSLDKAFINIAYALNDNKSEKWIFISPVSSEVVEGHYTAANRMTIQAVVDFILKIKSANEFYNNNNLASFVKTIIDLDGLEN